VRSGAGGAVWGRRAPLRRTPEVGGRQVSSRDPVHLRKEKMERAVDLILHLDQANSAQLRELVRLCCSERN